MNKFLIKRILYQYQLKNFKLASILINSLIKEEKNSEIDIQDEELVHQFIYKY